MSVLEFGSMVLEVRDNSQPGIIIRALREVQARDCVMLLHEIDKLGGGHFAALEQPMVFVVELRAAFRALPLGG